MRDTDQAINVLPHRKTSSYIRTVALPLCASHGRRIDAHDFLSLDAPWRSANILEVEAGSSDRFFAHT